jgi:hypothetical protein
VNRRLINGWNQPMSIFKIAGIAASIATLTACTSEASHPICTDQTSTTAYGVKWQDDLTAAHKAGKVTLERATALQGEILSKFGILKDKNWSGWCTFLDSVREEGGF